MKMNSLITFIAGACVCAQAATITVDVAKPGVKVSPLLYGIFFEEINRAGDGGIYAEMLQNRSFEDAPVPLGWTIVKGDGRMTLDKSQPLNANNPTSLRLDGKVSVANNGFKGAPYKYEEEPGKWMPAFEKGAKEMPNGVAVQKGKDYQLSLYARGQGPVTVTLEKQDGTALASHEVGGIGTEWKKFDVTLTPGATEPNARLVITSTGTVWLDMVSLMPKGEIFRADLLKMLADMKPAFLRFPGGCWVEGEQMRFAYRWKKTIGDVAERPGLWNRWGYYSTDGLGMYEYLLLCEALKAEPLFVINCGMSHKEVVPLDKMDEYIQDALDAIEYCNGPVDSKWGALRAKAGHPAPFNLKYMEIGNENGGQAYQDRYPLFHDAIKKRYPDMHLILDYVPCKTRSSEIVDEHYYNSPEFFMRNADRYDKYDRAAHKVYIGEYAVTHGSGLGNLRGAIGEAAFMTGMERNGDVVVMGSYAPLFEHVGWKHWNPNAILFDAARSYATPSWHVQTLFGRNRAEVVLPTTVSAPGMDSTETRGGFVGVGAWNTQVEYKDIKVTQGDKVLLQGRKGWSFESGNWAWDGDVLRQSGKGEDLRAYAGRKDWKDYTITLKARKLGGAEGFLVIFAAPDKRGKSWWNIGGWGNSAHSLEIRDVEHERVPGRIETGRWYDLKVELEGQAIRCYLDGKLVHEVTAQGVKSMYAVAGRAGNDVILKVVNAAGVPAETTINLQGGAKLDATAAATVLTSASGDDENSFDEPVKVAPKDMTIPGIAPSFHHTFPAHSVTVLRVKTGEPGR
jgi:alpha-L-arabinofuranosidase